MSLHASEARSHRAQRKRELLEVFSRHPIAFAAHVASWDDREDDHAWDGYIFDLGRAWCFVLIERSWATECQGRCAFDKRDPRECGCSGCMESLDREPSWWNAALPRARRCRELGSLASAAIRMGKDLDSVIARIEKADI